MKDIYIADLTNFEDGKYFDSFFLVIQKQQRTTQTNKPYLSLSGTSMAALPPRLSAS